MLTIDDIKRMLSAIDKHCGNIALNSKYNENKALADCVLALSAIIKDLLKIE